MPSHNDPEKQRRLRGERLILQYTGMAASYLAMLGGAVWLGLWLDRIIAWKWPLLVWILPLFCIIGMVIKAVRDTSK